MKNSGGYLGLGYIVSIILAIIPFTNLILGVLLRIDRRQYLLALLNVIIFPVFYVIDIISIILKNKLDYLI
ncbi:MAG: hypothetical protein GX304_01730 [Clostridiales bacterium]|jgi:hypothetical protein|nr:hypothetical protein [Clostridiales bacterium]